MVITYINTDNFSNDILFIHPFILYYNVIRNCTKQFVIFNSVRIENSDEYYVLIENKFYTNGEKCISKMRQRIIHQQFHGAGK